MRSVVERIADASKVLGFAPLSIPMTSASVAYRNNAAPPRMAIVGSTTNHAIRHPVHTKIDLTSMVIPWNEEQ